MAHPDLPFIGWKGPRRIDYEQDRVMPSFSVSNSGRVIINAKGL